MKKDTGARYEIIVDGVTRTHRDDLTMALDAAAHLRSKTGVGLVEVRDLTTGQPVTSDAPEQAPAGPLFEREKLAGEPD